ncbi:MAG TPA: VOC family protein [Chitinophagaceae bacterium]|nr:VOC family protein [Chitinophagaceae bacterium]
MSNPIFPCIWFDGNAKDAAEFYCGIFKVSSIKQTNTLLVIFELCGKQFMGLNGGPMFKVNPSISFFVKCSSIDETKEVWDKLMDGGSVLMQMDKYPWSERYGWLKDKFGVTWQILVHTDSGQKQSVCPSMLFTNDKFGKAEAAINFYTTVFRGSSIEEFILYTIGDPNAGKVMFSRFSLNGYTMIAMDGRGEHAYTFNEGVSLMVNCDTQDEIDYYWNKFIANSGQEYQCGWLKDKFGVSWQIVPSPLGRLITGPAAPDVIQAFMKMKKNIIADLENAAKG